MNRPSVTYHITPEDEGRTMKEFLRKKEGVSKKLLVRMKHEKSIFLNGEFTYLDHSLKAGDTIMLVMSEEESEHIIPQEMEIHIVFEDEDLMVLNKPAHQCVHPTLLHPAGTLANGVVHYWKQQGFNRKFRPVNRLDKDTTGLVIVAKNQFAHQQLAIVQKKHEIERTYEAIVHGRIEKDRGTIDAPIARHAESLMIREVREDGQTAITYYQVIERYADATYIQLRLKTGRTHQIRVHMSYIGHPLLGDDLYGGSREWIGRQALHGRYLQFPHPRSGEAMSFQVDPPEDFYRLISQLEESVDSL